MFVLAFREKRASAAVGLTSCARLADFPATRSPVYRTEQKKPTQANRIIITAASYTLNIPRNDEPRVPGTRRTTTAAAAPPPPPGARTEEEEEEKKKKREPAAGSTLAN